MQIFIKTLLSVILILVATGIGHKLPSTAGLIAVMPLTSVIILVWIYIENKGDPVVMQEFARGALWGILPSILFFFVALICFKKQLPLSVVLLLSFGVWTLTALIHQWMLK